MSGKTAHVPRGILTDPRDLELARARIQAGEPQLLALSKEVLARAEKHLFQKALSVTQNERLPPSGDTHDYMSVATYWWPNPDTADGLPYVRRDGEINPEFFHSDVDRIRKLCDVVTYLGLAAAISQEARFAEKAAALVRHWFIAPGTRMNPHLSYAQFVPGLQEGRSYGIIDFKPVRELLDVIGLLPAGSWTRADQQGLLDWMTAYLKWLTTSSFGKKESTRENNHGTWYDAQTLAVALFVGDKRVAQTICERAKLRIASQITPEGEQPEELARSRPLTYCMMNLQAFFDIATMAERCGEDLWNFETPDGRSLKKAAEWLLPFASGERSYLKTDIVKQAPQNYLSVFRRAAIKFDDERFEKVVEACLERDPHTANSAHLLQFCGQPAAKPSPPSRAKAAPATTTQECNFCGGTTFENWKDRPNSLCSRCHSQERTRVLRLFLDRLELGPDSKILHIAPERSLAAYLAERVGNGGGYDAVDINPDRYKFAGARKLDLVVDAEGLPSNYYDLILHVHVMEHLPCNVTSVLFHLHRALKATGVHLCCIPILKGRYAAEFSPMTPERALREFGHKEHVHRFGAEDIQQTLGMVFNLPEEYDLEDHFDSTLLDRFNIPEFARRGWSPHSVLALRKDEIKLRV